MKAAHLREKRERNLGLSCALSCWYVAHTLTHERFCAAPVWQIGEAISTCFKTMSACTAVLHYHTKAVKRACIRALQPFRILQRSFSSRCTENKSSAVAILAPENGKADKPQNKCVGP